jgi:hypothetical protein
MATGAPYQRPCTEYPNHLLVSMDVVDSGAHFIRPDLLILVSNFLAFTQRLILALPWSHALSISN